MEADVDEEKTDVLTLSQVLDEDDYVLLVCFLLLCICKYRNNLRNRGHLTRNALSSSAGSAWAAFYQGASDLQMINILGVTRSVFNWLLTQFQPVYWPTGRGRKPAMTSATALGLILMFMNSTISDTGLQMIFAQVPSTLARTRQAAFDALISVLRTAHESRIQWPSHEDMQRYSSMFAAKYPLLRGCFAVLDGTLMEIGQPVDLKKQQLYYSGRKKKYCINNVLLFGADGTLLHAEINFPGSFHDSPIARPIYRRMLQPELTPFPYFIISDSAFMHSDNLKDRVVTTLTETEKKKQQEIMATRPEHLRTAVQMINRAVTSCRQCVEWGNHSIKTQFRRLVALPMDEAVRRDYIECCLRLYKHTLCADQLDSHGFWRSVTDTA